MRQGLTGAVVVSFHPDEDAIENLRLLGLQLRVLVVVDNGSPDDALEILRESAKTQPLELIENGKNLGIATALNQGVRRLEDSGCEFIFLFDQDSTVTEGYVDKMRQDFTERARLGPLAILIPRYVDRRFGNTLMAPAGQGGVLEAATTSGSLMPTRLFHEAGFFADELFIDGVDYEYSLRVRRAGYTIAECKEAVLLHSPGHPTYHRMWKGRPFQVANYSAARRYYQERNKIWVAKRYWRDFAGFCAKQFLISLKDLLKIVLVEQYKVQKIRYFFLGVWHGLRGRTGPLDE